jgi:hypothetical protein
MMRLPLTFFFVALHVICLAQTEHTQAFPITDYMVPSGDSIMIVQVELPEKLRIAENTVGLLQPRWQQEDTAVSTSLGYGRCYLIKGNFHYFGIRLTPGLRKPKQGDLIYTKAEFPSLHSSLLQSIYSHHIQFLNAYGDPVFPQDSVWHQNSAKQDVQFIDRLVQEIQFVGKTMQDQNDQQDQVVKEGPYAGRKLFDLMAKQTTRADLLQFLAYIDARPVKYAGTSWSISEIFATWVVAGAPTVKD